MRDDDRSGGNAAPPGGTGQPPQDDPEDLRGLRLHRRLVDGDPLASSDLFDLYYQPLYRRAAQQIFDRTTGADTAHDIVIEALLKLIATPARYDPARGKSLLNYLRMDVQGDVTNHIQKVRRLPRVDRLDEPVGGDDGDVGNETVGGNIASEELTPEQLADLRSDDELFHAIRERVSETDQDRRVFDLQYIDGERSTDVFAVALGLDHLSPEDQVTEVQKVKDRLAKRLRRLKGQLR